MKTVLHVTRKLIFRFSIGALTATCAICGAQTKGKGSWGHDDGLGVLLYSPSERQNILAQRSGGGLETASTLLRYDGIVRRSSGKDTVIWGGKALTRGDKETPTISGVDAQWKGNRLRVGESLDTTTEKTQSPLPPNAQIKLQK
jgi:hypothetical protein